jgi:hypothetical protein
MLDKLIALTLELRELDSRASYFIAKELALIEISMLWYPDKFGDNLARLRSLSHHVRVTFKNNELADKLAHEIIGLAKNLAAKAE